LGAVKVRTESLKINEQTFATRSQVQQFGTYQEPWLTMLLSTDLVLMKLFTFGSVTWKAPIMATKVMGGPPQAQLAALCPNFQVLPPLPLPLPMERKQMSMGTSHTPPQPHHHQSSALAKCQNYDSSPLHPLLT
jgi:hypothetical protein